MSKNKIAVIKSIMNARTHLGPQMGNADRLRAALASASDEKLDEIKKAVDSGYRWVDRVFLLMFDCGDNTASSLVGMSVSELDAFFEEHLGGNDIAGHDPDLVFDFETEEANGGIASYVEDHRVGGADVVANNLTQVSREIGKLRIINDAGNYELLSEICKKLTEINHQIRCIAR